MKKSNARTASQLALAASMLAIPGVTTIATAQKPARKPAISQPETIVVKNMVKNVSVKLSDPVQIVGLDNARIIYRNARGEQFYLDPETGDMRFVADLVVKQTLPIMASKDKMSAGNIKFAKADVTIVGSDANGNVLHRTSRGDVFYLDAKTGDMVFVP